MKRGKEGTKGKGRERQGRQKREGKERTGERKRRGR